MIGNCWTRQCRRKPASRNGSGAAQELEKKISRIGPVNLVAIEEFEEESERKEYLDKQYADLTEALETLSVA